MSPSLSVPKQGIDPTTLPKDCPSSFSSIVNLKKTIQRIETTHSNDESLPELYDLLGHVYYRYFAYHPADSERGYKFIKQYEYLFPNLKVKHNKDCSKFDLLELTPNFIVTREEADVPVSAENEIVTVSAQKDTDVTSELEEFIEQLPRIKIFHTIGRICSLKFDCNESTSVCWIDRIPDRDTQIKYCNEQLELKDHNQCRVYGRKTVKMMNTICDLSHSQLLRCSHAFEHANWLLAYGEMKQCCHLSLLRNEFEIHTNCIRVVLRRKNREVGVFRLQMLAYRAYVKVLTCDV